MKSRTTAGFRRLYASSPKHIQRRALAAFRRFLDDPQHPGLRFKRVHTREPIYAARISRDFRALAVEDHNTWLWFWIGSHADYEKLLRDL